MLVDYHVHTSRCGHARGEMHEYVQHAASLELDEIGFSDHYFLYHLPPERRDPCLAMDESDLDGYFGEISSLQANSPALSIRAGLEVDYIPGWEGYLRQKLRALPLDYVYGSVHFVGDWDLTDSRQAARFSVARLEDLYREYFGLVAAAAGSGLYDIIGHADAVKKFGHRPACSLDGMYRHLAAALGRAGSCLEINTAGLRAPVQEVYPAPALLWHCRRQEVAITFGCDAHSPDDVGRDLDLAIAVAREAGYREMAVYEKRQRRLAPLG